jgi:hypothetical protein
MEPGLDTAGTEVIVATIADTAMVVLILHGVAAVVTEDNPGRRGGRLLGAESQVGSSSSHYLVSSKLGCCLCESEGLWNRGLTLPVGLGGLEGRCGSCGFIHLVWDEWAGWSWRKRCWCSWRVRLCDRLGQSREPDRTWWPGLGGLGQSATQAQLQLGFGSAEEGLVHVRLLGVEDDIGTGTVGIAFEERILMRGNRKKCFELIGEH